MREKNGENFLLILSWLKRDFTEILFNWNFYFSVST